MANGFDGIREARPVPSRSSASSSGTPPPGAELIKTGAPDAGLEWYWLLPDGREIAWQVRLIDSLIKEPKSNRLKV
jgi:hypothetical protein